MRPVSATPTLDCGVVAGYTVTLPAVGTATFHRVGDACNTEFQVVGSAGGVYAIPRLIKPGRWVAAVADCRSGCITHHTVEVPPTCAEVTPVVEKPACAGFCGYFGAPYAQASTVGGAALWATSNADCGCS